MFENINTSEMQEATDRVGGFSAHESDVYKGTIKVAYITDSTAANSKAQAVNLVIVTSQGEVRERIWVTNKEGKATYPDKQDPSKLHGLPGFHTINDLCLIVARKELPAMVTEKKMVNLWDNDQKKEVPTSVPVLTELTGGEALFAILKQTVDKQKSDGAGNYVNTGETRDENVIDKVMDLNSKATVSEAKEASKTGEPINARFHDAWLERNKGKTKDKTDKSGQGGKAVGGVPQAASAAEPKKSLFG